MFIDKMMTIFLEGIVISDVKEFRIVRKAMGYYDKTNNFETFLDKIEEFLNGANLDIFESRDIEDDRNGKNMHKYVTYLFEELGKMNSDYMSDFLFVNELEKLNERIAEILERIE